MKLYALQTIDSSIYICDNESYQINIVYLNRLYRNVYLKQHIYYRKRVYIKYF